MQTDITSKGLQDSEEERGEPQRFKFLCQDIVDTANIMTSELPATQELTCQPILSRHYASMTQDGRQLVMSLICSCRNKIGAELHIFLEEGTYHKRLFRGPRTYDIKTLDGPSLSCGWS
jgi:hypothetical protein